jgi:hypothetical protein
LLCILKLLYLRREHHMADVITLNEIDEIKKLVITDNTSNSAGTLSQKLTHLCQQIGTAKDAGGSEVISNGTVMAKLNALLINNTIHGSVTYDVAGSYTWTAPFGASVAYIIACGASGGGGGGGGGSYHWTNSGGGGGGGSGSTAATLYAIVPISAGKTYNLTIGKGGAGGSGGELSKTEERAKNGSSGKTGEDTLFDNLLTIKGGAGGKGGLGGASTSDNSSASWARGDGGKGANASDICSVITFNDMIVSYFDEISGTDGDKGSLNWASGFTAAGSGGNSNRNIIGIGGGAGGAGGNCQYNNVSNGLPGAAGSDGYIKIFW